MSSKQLDIILVSYNTRELTLRAIASVYEQTRETGFRLFVIDNDSQDGSADAIEEQFPDVNLVRSPDNIGFARGINLGASIGEAPQLLFLNPDTVILENAIDRLCEFAAEHPHNGIWGGITLNNDLSINSHNAWSRPTTLSLLFSATGLAKAFRRSCFFNRGNYGCWQRDSVKEVDIIQGCFFLTTRKLWQQLEGFDPAFFMYGEEADYCLKAIALSHQPIVTPTARIIHHGGASETTHSGKMIKLLKAKVELVKRHSPGIQKPLHTMLLYTYVFNQLLGHRLLSLIEPSKKPAFEEWKTIFAARREWLKGWT